MDEILRHLRPGARVLDLGSLTGSFHPNRCPGAQVLRLDLQIPARASQDSFVQADAARLPFPDACFDAVIANHSLEHIQHLAAALREIGRVVRSDGSLYVAVPDASTLSDRLYRWLCPGGGHINPFRSADALAAEIARITGLKPAGSRALHSSFEYLNRYRFPPRAPRRLWLAGNGNRGFILGLSYAARCIDRVFHTRLSAYGWALYFGNLGEAIEPASWSNVCVECGSGFPAAWLQACHLVRRRFIMFPSYRCPSCNAWNFFTPDSPFRRTPRAGV